MKIKQLPSEQEYKYLGTYQGTTKQQKKQFEDLDAKAKAHTRAITLSSVSHSGAWIYYKSCYLASVGYPLATTYLSDKQLHDLQKTMIPATLSKMGYMRTTSHNLVFAPTFGPLFTTRETVAIDTLATRATSLIVDIRRISSRTEA